MRALFIISAVAMLFISCQTDPEPIQYGKDQCAYCRMTIADSKFGSELITDKGRVYKYDAAECMVNQLAEEAPAYSRLLATPYDAPNTLVDVDQLRFLISMKIKSPMGEHLAAYKDFNSAPEDERENLMTWEELQKKLKD